MWILYTALYGVLIGFYTVLRKKASDKSSIIFMIALSSTVGFLLVLWISPEAFATDFRGVLLFLLKSIIVFTAWIFELIALRHYFMSSLQPINSIKVFMSFIISLLIFNEPVIWWKFSGVLIIFIGLIFLNQFDKRQLKKQSSLNQDLQISSGQKTEFDKLKKKRLIAIIFFILSCCLNETSGILDKVFMDSYTPMQMQFWFMFFIAMFAWLAFLALCIKNKKMLASKRDWGNWLIYFCGIILVVADRLLFTALTDPNVLVSCVSILKQLSTIVAVVFGGLLFKEKNLKYKLVFLAFILIGIVIVLI